jgi:hypothetical protein
MNEPDNSSQTNESPKNACVVNTTTRTLSAEQLRQFLSDHRNRLQKAHFELVQTAGRMKKEISAIDAVLADLTMG